MSAQTIALVLNYRGSERSVRCVESLLEAGMAAVVVWDNSADDGISASALRDAYGDNRRVMIHISERNLGFAAGVNRGLACCAALDPEAWVLLINDDAQLRPGALQQLEHALAENPAGRLAFPTIDHAGRVQGYAYCHRLTGALSSQPKPGFFPYASGCCLLLAMNRLQRPVFDEDFFMYGEDCELGWRLGRQPGGLVHVDQVLVDHQGSASSGVGSVFYETHMVAAHLILARKLSRSRFDRVLLHAARGAMLIARATVRAARYRSLIPFRALWSGSRIALAQRN